MGVEKKKKKRNQIEIYRRVHLFTFDNSMTYSFFKVSSNPKKFFFI